MKSVIKILVPLDFSSCSDNALIFAMQFAHKLNASLQILNVPSLDSQNMVSPVAASFAIESTLRQTKLRINKSIEKARNIANVHVSEDLKIEAIVKMGNIEATICDIAEVNGVDYIIMGTQGENSTIDKYLGSIASNILKKAPCPVMVIPENTELPNEMKVGYATDFMDADPYEIWKIMKLFSPFLPIIKCIHFNGNENHNVEKVEEHKTFLADTNPDLEVEFYNFTAEDKVKEMNVFVDQHHINLLVMYKPKRSFLGSLFHKSYTQNMAKHTKVPLLVLKEV